jgi:ornithine carbamoyltransferase
MSFNLRNRNFLKELDFTVPEWAYLLRLSMELKAAKESGTEVAKLQGKEIALIFEKASTRTRCAFEVAASDQGASVTYLDPGGSHIGIKESMKDTARVLGRMYDGIQYRGFSHAAVETLGEFAGVPVWNGLTDTWHPTQSLCDIMTMIEHSTKPAHEIVFAYCGDARNNTGNSLMIAGAMTGCDGRIVAPKQLWNSADVTGHAKRICEETGARLLQTDSVEEGVAGADFVYTDVWVSMGEPAEIWKERVDLLRAYQVNQALVDATGNPNVKFMHCLPAFHNRETKVGEEVFQQTGMDGLEVTDEIFESRHSIVFDQAENRLHTIKAIMVATLGS